MVRTTMMNKSGAEVVLFEDLPSPEAEQFRASSLSLWNWGTFSRLHTMRFSRAGHIILGPSGAGKSTLEDAMSAMTVPPQKVRFNAAAEEGERAGRDRTLMSYVRGAWAERGEEGSQETAKQFLRPDATWSAISLEFRNELGRVVTLVRVLWIKGAGTSAKLHKHFMVVEGEFDLAELKEFDGERRSLKQPIDRPGVRHHDDQFAAYQEHWCRIFGIDDPSVLDLLHKAQSTKSLGDLNSFLREFMLAEPETFDKAQSLIDEFINLEETHRSVVTARRQIEVLTPALTDHNEHVLALAEIERNDGLLSAIPAFRHSLEVGLLETEIDALRRDRAVAAAEREEIVERLGMAADEIQGLERQRLEQGGGSIQEKERRIAELTNDRARRDRDRTRAQQACQALGWDIAEDAGGFTQQVQSAKSLADGSAHHAASRKEAQDDLTVELHEQDKTFRSLTKEVQSLEGNPSSIPHRVQDLRTRLCEALNLPLAKVVFVGELLQVHDSERETWGPAAEQLLRSFALDMLIDESDDRRVAKWVDETNMRGRIVYRPVRSGAQPASRDPQGPDSILNKLEIKPGHPFGPWVRRELSERFDYLCVKSPADLSKGEKRLTAQGQIRHAGRRTVKDDSVNMRDRQNWVLGFDNREKLARLRELAADAGAALARKMQQKKDLDQEIQRDLLRAGAAQALVTLEWGDIDVATVAQHIGQVEMELVVLRAGNPTLTHIEALLVEARRRKEDAHGDLADRKLRIRQADEREPDMEVSLQRARMEAAALTMDAAGALRMRLPENWTMTRASLPEGIRELESGLQKEIRRLDGRAATLAGSIRTVFADFLREWPEEAGALQADLAYAQDFFTLLQRVQIDGLPQVEARFLDLLQKQSTQRLAELSQLLTQAKREIDSKLVDVNDALQVVPYNPDSYLEIESIDMRLPDVKAFRDSLAQLFAEQRNQTDDPLEAERRFEVLRGLVTRLRTDEAWRSLVLDVRRHVQFMAVERDRATGREIERYTGSSSKSGGQRQKLTSTCLAAALRFKLGGSDGGVPSFGTVVLDEAFTKTDSEFTATAMQIFTELGFQMIVATPLKSVMTLEPFTGGATYVSIANRHTSSLLSIEYDTEARRLSWSDKTRAVREADEARDDAAA
jgi:uncharacterized protein YPO0396